MLKLDKSVTVEAITPYQDFVLIRPDKTEEQRGGILLPPTVTSYNPNYFPQLGTVVKVGPKVKEIASGERVFYERYGGKLIVLEREEWLLIREADLWGVEIQPAGHTDHKNV